MGGEATGPKRPQGKDAAQAGILAEGTIIEYPRVQTDDVLSADFWKQAPEQDEALRVKIRLNRIASKKQVLKREWMKDDSVLKNLLIMRQALARTSQWKSKKPNITAGQAATAWRNLYERPEAWAYTGVGTQADRYAATHNVNDVDINHAG